MKLLSISTSTPRGSVAVLEDGRAIASLSYTDPAGHAERLFDAIDDALREAGVGRSGLSAVACDVGPGSFTGVRVGVASTKGVAMALAIPTIGVLSLEAMAAAAFAEERARGDDLVVTALDAKKGEVFLAVFDAALTAVVPPLHVARGAVDEAILAPFGGRRVVAVGEIAGEIEPLRTYLAPPRGQVSAASLTCEPAGSPAREPAATDLPDATWVGRVATSRGSVGWTDPAALEALYVRAPDAKPAKLG